MSWITKLNEAYECGISGDAGLIPVGFIKKEIKYHVILRADGTFDHADPYQPKTYCTIPTSPKAEARTGEKGTPFPLAEQLQYLVCEEGHPNPRYELYMKALGEWCAEPDAPECIRILKSYLEKKTLLADMTERSHLKVKYSKETQTGLQYGKGEDAKAFLVFSVHCPDGVDQLWEREDVRTSWSRRLAASASEKTALCYAEGSAQTVMENHPKVQGNAKLVSAKDNEYPFLYKGRFSEDGSAAAVGYEAAAKAYKALEWLIAEQGYRRYGLTLAAWNTVGGTLSGPLPEKEGVGKGSAFSFGKNALPAPVPENEKGYDEEEDEEEPVSPDTFAEYGKAIAEAAAGLRNCLNGFDRKWVSETVILGMEAATDGRMSVNYYREIPNGTGEENDYPARLAYWYETCCWERYEYKKKKTAVFTPTPRRIAETVMGPHEVSMAIGDKRVEKAVTKQMRALQLRLLDCITQKQRLPADLVKSAFDRVTEPQRFRNPRDNSWSESTWRECLSAACALIRKRLSDENRGAELPDASLQTKNRDRSYLFGRILAVADYIEYKAKNKKDVGMTNVEYTAKNRKDVGMTNALSVMPAFVRRPARTWLNLHGKLLPYLAKLSPGDADRFQRWLEQIEGLFREGERTDAPLSELFLPGYYSQRQTLYGSEKVPEPEPFVPEADRSVLYGYLAAVSEHAELYTTNDRAGRSGQDTMRSTFPELRTTDDRAGRTNALRMSETLIARPVGTWALLLERTVPYLEKRGADSTFDTELLRACEALFPETARNDPAPLDSGFLHGYYTMRGAVRTWKPPAAVPVSELVSDPVPMQRDDAFGLLLAIENRVERFVMDSVQKTEKQNFRLSSAFRYLSAFDHRPWSTWTVLKEKLSPYLHRLPDGGRRKSEKIEQLEALIKENGWDSDTPLQGSCLHQFLL